MCGVGDTVSTTSMQTTRKEGKLGKSENLDPRGLHLCATGMPQGVPQVLQAGNNSGKPQKPWNLQ